MKPRINIGIGALTPAQAAAVMGLELGQLGDGRKAASAQRFFAEPVQVLGIDAPTLRGVARNWIAKLKVRWHAEQAIEFCECLLEHPEIEARAAGFLVLGAFEKEFDPALLHRAKGWLERRLDNWALVDGFSSAVLSPLLGRFPELMEELERWTKAEVLWVRRAAVVTLVPFARRGERLEESYRLVAGLLADPEDLMHKACGWLLREAGKADSNRLREFLLRHRASVPRTTVRYAIEGFPAAERKQLLEQTRGIA